MSAWELPKSAEINGHEYAIRSDYRAVLDVLTVLSDAGLTDAERGAIAMEVFYEDYPAPGDYEAACEYLMWFVNGGDAGTKRPKRKLADWNQDFPLIVAPVNRVLGYEARACEYLHWFTFLSAYYEVGDCMFAQVVAIRKKRAKGKKLEKHEREFYRENRDLVDFRVEETDAEKAILDEWM